MRIFTVHIETRSEPTTENHLQKSQSTKLLLKLNTNNTSLYTLKVFFTEGASLNIYLYTLHEFKIEFQMRPSRISNFQK